MSRAAHQTKGKGKIHIHHEVDLFSFFSSYNKEIPMQRSVMLHGVIHSGIPLYKLACCVEL